MALIRVLVQQHLEFRCSSDQLFTNGNGYFLKFAENLAIFDPLMKDHLSNITEKEISVHYSGKDIQMYCLWKDILSQQRIRHLKILQSIYFAYDVGIISSYSNIIKMY